MEREQGGKIFVSDFCFQLELVAREVEEGKRDNLVARGCGKLQPEHSLLGVKALLVEQLQGDPGAG